MQTTIGRAASRLISAVTAAMLLTSGASASIISGNVTSASGSQPLLNIAGNAWQPFNIAQSVPSASKGGITVRFIADDGDPTAFPLNAVPAAVTLRPTTAGPAIDCDFSAIVPVLTAANAGQCFFRISPFGSGDTVQIFYLGLLGQGQNIRYTVSGLLPAAGAHTIQPFDSDQALVGTPPSPTLARKPARLVVVLDKSGSMDWSAKPADATCGPLFSPTPACRRWNILTSAAAQFVNVAKAYAMPGDQLGVVFFDTTASNTGGYAAMTPITLGAVTTAIGAHSPGGSTSLGAGVTNLDLHANNSTFNNMTLVFTDGEQNTQPFLVSDGTQLLINATQNQPFGNPWPQAGDAGQLCTFRLRFDDPAGPMGTTTLQQIANIGCGGLMNSSASLNAQPADLIGFFLQVLDLALIGDKLEVAQITSGSQTLPASGTPSTGSPVFGKPVEVRFLTGRQDGAFTLLLNWTRPPSDEFTTATGVVLSKDGVDFVAGRNSALLVESGRDHLALTLRAPYCATAGTCVKPEGEWTLRFVPRGAANSVFAYTTFVTVDNAVLATRYSVRQPTPGVGRPLALRAELAEGGKPVSGLPAGSVRAVITGPKSGLGNVLSLAKVHNVENNGRDSLSGAGLKALGMLNDPAERAKLLAALALQNGLSVPLNETQPGIYTASFLGTAFEGVYRVTFDVRAKTKGNGPVTRTFSTDHYVPVAVDPAATARGATTAALTTGCTGFPGGCFTITFKPVDTKGNLMGPGKTAIITVGRFDGRVIDPLHDNLDGTYAIKIGYSDKVMPLPVDIGGSKTNVGGYSPRIVKPPR